MCACYVNADFLCATCSIKRICDQILYEKHKKRLAGQAFRNTSYICLIFICLEIRANDRSFLETSAGILLSLVISETPK